MAQRKARKKEEIGKRKRGNGCESFWKITLSDQYIRFFLYPTFSSYCVLSHCCLPTAGTGFWWHSLCALYCNLIKHCMIWKMFIFWPNRLCIWGFNEQPEKPKGCQPCSSIATTYDHFLLSMLGLSSTWWINAVCVLWAQCLWNVCASVWQMLRSVLCFLLNHQLW